MTFLVWLENQGIDKLSEIISDLKENNKFIEGSDRRKLETYFPDKEGSFTEFAKKERLTIIRQLKKKTYKFGTFLKGQLLSTKVKRDNSDNGFIQREYKSKERVITRDRARDYLTQKLILSYFEKLEAEGIYRQSKLSYAYQKNKSATEAIRTLKRELRVKSTYTQLHTFDLEKFFDRIPHKIIIEKLEKYFGNDDHLIAVISNYLTSKYFDIPVRENFTDDFPTLKNQKATYWRLSSDEKQQKIKESAEGVYQGGVLSGFLANLVLHDLDKEMEAREDIIYMRYADDFIVITEPANTACIKEEMIQPYCDDNGLSLSEDKCDSFEISRSKPVEFLGFQLHRNPLNQIIVGLKYPNYKKIEERFSNYLYEGQFYNVTSKNTINFTIQEYCLNYYPQKQNNLNGRFPKWIEINNNTIDMEHEFLKLLTPVKQEQKGTKTYCWFNYFYLVNDVEQLDALSKTLNAKVKAIKQYLPNIEIIKQGASFRTLIKKRKKVTCKRSYSQNVKV